MSDATPEQWRDTSSTLAVETPATAHEVAHHGVEDNGVEDNGVEDNGHGERSAPVDHALCRAVMKLPYGSETTCHLSPGHSGTHIGWSH